LDFKVLLGAVTLFLAGFLLFALALGYVDVAQVVGLVLLVDGAVFATHGVTVDADATTKRFSMVWGSVLALVGVAILLYPTYGSSIFIWLVGAAMVLIALFVLYGEAYGGRK